MKPAEIDHWTNALEELEKFLRTFPMSKHYRETTTFRQFNEMLVAKQREMGLTEDVLKELRSIGFYPVSTDGWVKSLKAWSLASSLRWMSGLWNRSM